MPDKRVPNDDGQMGAGAGECAWVRVRHALMRSLQDLLRLLGLVVAHGVVAAYIASLSCDACPLSLNRRLRKMDSTCSATVCGRSAGGMAGLASRIYAMRAADVARAQRRLRDQYGGFRCTLLCVHGRELRDERDPSHARKQRQRCLLRSRIEP